MWATIPNQPMSLKSLYEKNPTSVSQPTDSQLKIHYGCKMLRKRKNTEADFWSHVIKTDGCWVWQGSFNPNGYGQFSYNGVNGSHRISWMLKNGQIPLRMHVLHRCDNPNCVNPDHLFIGKCVDNTRDMIRKGRGRVGVKYCCYNNTGYRIDKLSNSEIKKIALMRESGKSWDDISKRFGMKPSGENFLKFIKRLNGIIDRVGMLGMPRIKT